MYPTRVQKLGLKVFLVVLVSSTVAAQTVSSSYELYLGSPSTMLYFSSKCDEAKKMIRRAEFSSAEAAEKAGYRPGECTITRPDQKAEVLFDSILRKQEGEATDASPGADGSGGLVSWSGECGGKVVGVTDGDTVTILNSSNKEIKVRLAGIDAPESGQGFGQAAKSHLSSLVFVQHVKCDADKIDDYGRIIGTLRFNGNDVNLQMVKDCMAWHYKKYEGEQSATDRVAYSAAETSSRNRRCGLWQDGNPIAPWAFRQLDSTGYPDSTAGGNAPGSSSPTRPKTQRVESYTRKDGTRVRSYKRSRPRN